MNSQVADRGLGNSSQSIRRSDFKKPPLSFVQERLWFLEKLGLVGSAYVLPLAVRLQGAMDERALEIGLIRLVERHESLRTRIESVEGRGVQIIDAPGGFELRKVDLSGLAPQDRDPTAQRLVQEEVGRPFEVTGGKLFRAVLMRLGDREHVLSLSMHHIISDGWSIGIMIQELTELYRSEVEGRPAALAALPVQYADYAVWQRERLKGEVLQTQMRYWKEQLAGIPAVLDLPTDRPRPAMASFAGSMVSFSVSAELTSALRELGRTQGATLFMVLLTSFQLLLSKWSGQSDIVVGSPIAGRQKREFEGLIGFFVNTLVMRTVIGRAQRVRDVLQSVRATSFAAYAYQDIPFEKLVMELHPQRDLSVQPIFQVWFVLQGAEARGASWDLPGIVASGVPVGTPTSKFDLSLLLSESSEGLSGVFEYATDLFDRSTIERLAGWFEVLLQEIVGRPDAEVSRLALMSPAEREQVLVQWNQTQREYPRGCCLHDLISEQARHTPRAIALAYENQQVTYEELEQRSNQLAHHLRGLGVRVESIVGLCVGRDVEMVVSVLGILKAGGAYVPLDPQYPIERLQYMLADARVSVLVVHSTLLEKFPVDLQVRVLAVDTESKEIEKSPATPLQSGVHGGNAAYVIYTSGSTGRPKGVLVQHEGLVSLVATETASFDVRGHSRVLQFSRLSFDISIWEIGMALSAGATLCLLPSSDQLARVLKEQRVDMAILTPSVLSSLGSLELPSLKTLVAGAESCPQELAAYWLSRCNLLSAYGPTETTVCASYCRCERGKKVAIGRPVGNTSFYVLNEELEPVPIGAAGELYIGGVGLARGYLGRADLTAERFIANPIGVSGSRLYRTGDQVRYRADGNLEFLGRLDQQVKIRGHRIELEEIEAALARHPRVKQAIVSVREDIPGERRLVGYVVGDTELQSDQLRSHLRDILPEYMVPAAFVMLQELPVTANGKLDRKGLPAPEAGHGSQRYVAPRMPVEEALARVWSEVLHTPRIGIHDDFFELGGHSLLATQMIATLEDMFSVEIPIRYVFEAPTIRELACCIENLMCAPATLESLPLRARSHPGGESELSYAQERLWFLEKLGLVGSAYVIPLAVRLQGTLDERALEISLIRLVERHESLRTRIESVEGRGVQIIDAPGDFELRKVDLSGLAPQDRDPTAQRLVQEEVGRPFQVTGGKLFRAVLMRLGDREHVLSLSMHHIISDGWSIGIMIQELTELYRSEVEGRPAALAALPVQYADYAVWQRERLQGEMLQTLMRYWKEQLAGIPAVLDLPTDRPRPAMASFAGSMVSFSVSAELTSALRELGRTQGATLFMVLLTSFQLLLSKWSGQSDIVVGSPIAGRRRRELEEIVGLFANTLVLRAQTPRNLTFKQLLQKGKQVALEAYTHQDIPFEKLVMELHPQRDLSVQPIFQVWFVLQGAEARGAAWDLPGLAASGVSVGAPASKFDLSLLLSEGTDSLSGVFEYSADLFERSTIERLAGWFGVLLQEIVRRPDAPVGRLSLMSAAEREQVLVQWNQTQRESP